MTFLAIVQLLGGFGILTLGGHYLVEGATRIALYARISTAVVGLTIVALGTSAPELAVSVGAALRGATDISYSNVVGSNIFNIGLIMGITAVLHPFPVGRQTIRLEYPFMILASWIMLLLSRDGRVDHLEGAFFLFSLSGFVVYTVRLARQEVAEDEAMQLEREVIRTARIGATSGLAWGKSIVIVLIGIAGLAGGAELMVRGAVTVAQTFGVTERLIGLTVVAMGTSLPELTTSVVAARRKESAIALGNLIGSNIFNILAILGTTSVIVAVPVNPDAVAVDNWVMLAFSVGLFPLMLLGHRVSRADGILLLTGFFAYLAFLFTSL